MLGEKCPKDAILRGIDPLRQAINPLSVPTFSIEIKELERVVIYLGDFEIGSDSCRGGSRTAPTLKNILPFPGNHYESYQGYLVSGDQLKPLPIGSTLDGERRAKAGTGKK